MWYINPLKRPPTLEQTPLALFFPRRMGRTDAPPPMDQPIAATSPPFPLFRLLAGSVCISFSAIFIKLAHIAPDSAGFYRMLFAALSLLALLRAKGGSLAMSRRQLLLLCGCGLTLSLDFMCWHRSILLVGPGLSTLLGNCQVFFTALFSFLFLRQRISTMFMFAVATALVGLFFVTGGDWEMLGHGFRLGVVLGLSTAVFYSGYIMLLKQALTGSALSGVTAMLVISVVSSVLLGLVVPFGGESFVIPDAGSLFALLGVGVLSTTIGWSLISSAIREIPATLAGLVLLTQPALSFLWDVLIFHRPTTAIEVVGIVLILLGIYVGSYRRE